MKQPEFTSIVEKIISNPPEYLTKKEVDILTKYIDKLNRTVDYKGYFLIAFEILKVLKLIDPTIFEHILK